MEARRTSCFCSTYALFDEAREVATLQRAAWRNKALLSVDGHVFEMFREKWLPGPFLLVDDAGRQVASGEKTSMFRRGFEVCAGPRHWHFEPLSAFDSCFVLRDGDRAVGTIRKRSLFSGVVEIDLPADVELPVRAFLLNLVIHTWSQQAAAAGAGS
jgi:hypothetical protein